METSSLVLNPDQLAEALPDALNLAQGHYISQCLNALVKLGVPDIIGNRELSFAEILQQLPKKTNQQALLRTMRYMVARGVFQEHANPEGQALFSLTPTGSFFQAASPSSLAWGLMFDCEPAYWNACCKVPDFVCGQTSESPFRAANGKEFFDFMAVNSHAAGLFNNSMTKFSSTQIELILKHVDWHGFSGKTVVDIGGNTGTVMQAVAAAFPDINCISFDLPGVIDKSGCPPKGVSFAKGDMFDSTTIPECDVIFMKYILHDWADEAAQRILRSCHSALKPGGKVVLAELVLPELGEISSDNAAKFDLDAIMLVIGGQERSLSHWKTLAAETGFGLDESKRIDGEQLSIIILNRL